MELSRYLKVYPCADKPGRVLLVATRRCAVLETSDNMWKKISTGDDLADKERDALLRLGVLVPDCAAEREELLETFTRANSKNRPFTALVTLTLECNLACVYCFEDPFRGRFIMSDATADRLIQRMSERMEEGLNVTIDFYGGEPLLALPVLKRIAAALSAAALDRSVRFSFSIISNGTLLSRRTIQELVPLGLDGIMVTLDGPLDVHDRQRPFVSGKGSFDTILANIKETWDLTPLDLVGKFTCENYHRFPELLDYLIAEGVTPEMLKVVVFSPVFPKADGSVSSDFSSSCAASDEPWLIEAGLFLRGEILKRGFKTPKPQMAGCMVEFANDMVVGYDGSIYKCPAFMGQEKLRVGSLADGVGDYRESHNLDVWKTEACLECAYLPLCFGGCRFFRKLKSGAIDGVDCRRVMLDASLETIVRQDLGLSHFLKADL